MRFLTIALASALALTGGLQVGAALAEGLDPAQPLWMRTPAISPDGSTLAFTYRGRIHTVDAAGGEAKPLTDPQFRSTDPVWAPDGKSIAFSADVFNAGDVYTVPLDGGEIRRLTYGGLLDLPLAFTPDGSDVIVFASGTAPMNANFMDGISRFFPGKVMSVPAKGGRERPFMPVPTRQASLSNDGKLLAYASVGSLEVTVRKRQISDGTSDIWIFDRTTGRHRQLTHHRSNEKSPVFSADGRFVYYTAEMPANGEVDVDAQPVSTNVWRIPVDGAAAPEQLTFHDTLPVRGLSISRDGTLAYGYDGEIWTLAPGGKPAKVAVRIAQGTLATGREPVDANDQVTEVAVSPDGSELALIARGDVFVVQAATGKTRRITDTPQAERSVGFSPDGRKLLYASDRQIDWDLFESRIVRASDAGFVEAAEIEETVLLDTETDLLQPLYSPKGDKVAYRDGRNALHVLDIESGQTSEALPDSASYSYSEGDLSHAWSPDGHYLTTFTGLEIGNSEVEVIEVATGLRHDISRNGFADKRPLFSRDGAMVYWTSDRFTTRQLDDQTATGDVVGTFLSREAAKAFADRKPIVPGAPDFAGAPDRTLRLTGLSQTVLFTDLGADGETLTVVSTLTGADLFGYAFDIRTGAAKPLFQAAATGTEAFAVDRDGRTLYVTGAGKVDAYDLATGAASAIPFDTTAPRDLREEMAYLFDHQWRLVQSKFYDKAMHGVDWPKMRGLYAKHLPHISHWEDLAELVAEMQGELNASHMFSSFKPDEPRWDRIGMLGLYYDRDHAGPGFKVAGVLDGGPADAPGSLLVPGAVIMAVDGVTIGPDAEIGPLLNGKIGKTVLLGVAAPGSGLNSMAEQTVTPIDADAEAHLAYLRWVKQRRAIVETLSGGRLGYVHVAAMNDLEMRKVFGELLGRYDKAEAAVIDVRFNTGGFLHDQLVTFVTGRRHSGLFTRNGADLGLSPYDRWARPTAMVQNAFSYSDGSIFPAYYKIEGLGPIAGDRVPGTGTAVYGIPQLEPRLEFAVAQLGFRTKEGRFFENSEIVPDILVPTDPNALAPDHDPQLEAAVKALLETLDRK
ncbi:S41 family peptidase [Mongoliimonas terrestris]|uniref:S41 family peptidase n=1 Tax=Mongoliimonas terrestris TaxID=1709001 RepID=UPI0009495A7B|nr:S41 family peptidase [Mongoliimonas terrestris]